MVVKCSHLSVINLGINDNLCWRFKGTLTDLTRGCFLADVK